MACWGPKPAGSGPDPNISTHSLKRSVKDFKSSESLRNSLLTNRCLILADGFYCWKQVGKQKKVPYRIIANHKKLICFAGIWKLSIDENNKSTHSFILITRPSYKPVNEICETIPVIIESGKEMAWLEGKNMDITKLIDMMEIEDWALLNYYSVSPHIKNTKIDKPDLIKPTPPSDQLGNLTLFN
jgi:putative SOS response-associated peptidase YedK